MNIGIGLPNQVLGADPTIIPAWAGQAEQAGFTTLATIGRIAYPGVMDTVALAVAAAATRRVELLSTVLLGPVWPPVLLAKEIAGIDAVSGGRLTLGLGLGIRPDDFVVAGLGAAARGKRLDRDLEIYQRVWGGERVGGGPNAAVTPGAREVPLMFGGTVQASYDRVARWGTGYISGALPSHKVERCFEATLAAWDKAGREGAPRLVGNAYFALGDGDGEQGRSYVRDYFTAGGAAAADFFADGVALGPDAVRETIAAFAEIGATDLILNPTVGDIDEIGRLADILVRTEVPREVVLHNSGTNI